MPTDQRPDLGPLPGAPRDVNVGDILHPPKRPKTVWVILPGLPMPGTTDVDLPTGPDGQRIKWILIQYPELAG